VGVPAPRARYRLLTDADAVQGAIPTLLSAPVIGLDTETTDLDPHRGRIRLIQLATPGQVYLVDASRVGIHLLRPVLESPQPKVLHNAKFDLQFLLACGLEVNNVFDTMLADQVLRGSKGYRGLADLAREYLVVVLDKALQKADWTVAELTPVMLEYAAQDAAVLPHLYEHLVQALKREGLLRVAKLENRAVPAVAWLEFSGVPFDADAWRVLADGALAELLRLEDELNDLAGREINWDSPHQLLNLLRERGLELPNTTENTLKAHQADPLVAKLLEYREAAKRCNTYGLDFLSYIHPITGRIHADWHQIGADSGRMSCNGPNLQNIPRNRNYRACFRAPEGRVLVKADYSQIELRIAAEISQDKRMLEAYRQGADLHELTSRLVLGRSEVTKEDRQAAKALNFGLIYGMGPASLREYAASGYQVSWTEEEARRFWEAFFKAYPGINRWHEAQPKGPITTVTLAGRKRFGVEKFTEKLNTPVQGTGADGLKAALALLWETRHQCPSARPVLAVHDEIVIECDETEAEAAKDWLVASMQRGMEAFLKRVPVVVEAVIAKDWGGD